MWVGWKIGATAAAAICAVLLSTSPAAAGTTLLTREDSVERALVTRINLVRKAHGLRPLRLASSLRYAARRHATSIGKVGYFKHDLYTPKRSVDWTPFGTWIRWYWPGPGYRSWSAGENLAWGAPDLTARQTVRRWLASPGHRANLLSAGWRRVGVAMVHVDDPRGYFGTWNDVTIAVAEFGRRS
jgi:uncharacterized protein YkwD